MPGNLPLQEGRPSPAQQRVLRLISHVCPGQWVRRGGLRATLIPTILPTSKEVNLLCQRFKPFPQSENNSHNSSNIRHQCRKWFLPVFICVRARHNLTSKQRQIHLSFPPPFEIRNRASLVQNRGSGGLSGAVPWPGVYSFSLEEGGVGHHQGRNLHWCGDPAFLPQTLPEMPAKFTGSPHLFLKQKWHKHHNTMHGDQVALEYSLTAFLEAPKRGQTGLWDGVGVAPKIQRTPIRPQIPWGMRRE